MELTNFKQKRTLSYIDLFAGAGGLSEGFIKNGFEPIIHVEMNVDACCTLKTRLAYHYLRCNNQWDIYSDYLKGNISRSHFYKQLPENLLNSILNVKIEEKTLNYIYEQIDKNLES